MRATETIYREMLTAYAKRRGGQLQEDCDLSVRLWAAAAQIQALEAQAEWVPVSYTHLTLPTIA